MKDSLQNNIMFTLNDLFETLFQFVYDLHLQLFNFRQRVYNAESDHLFALNLNNTDIVLY